MTIRGTKDLFGQDYALFLHIKTTFEALANKYDAQFISTSSLEAHNIIVRTSGADSDIASKEMFFVSHQNSDNFIDTLAHSHSSSSHHIHSNTEQIILKPEGTASAIRALSELNIQMQEPLKIAYIDRLYRYCRPQKGRQREFHQVGIEFFGQHHTIDIQSISMAVSFLQSLHLLEYVTLNINTIGSAATRSIYSKALGEYFAQHTALIDYIHINPLRTLDKLSDAEKANMPDMPNIYDYLTQSDKDYFNSVLNGLHSLGINFTINSSIIRGLDYYSHIVFEFTTQSITAQNTILAGGRYDNLISQISDTQSNSAIGWAAGIERLMLLSREYLKPMLHEKTATLFINLNCDQYSLSICQQLRAHTSINMITVTKLQKGLSIANKLGYTHIIICGENEMLTGQLLYKNLQTSTQKLLALSDLIILLTHK